ncbi:hypothetical protein [Desulfobulbus elongatus]|uniref:hypothetical protein n=1 Tax=Desulfobulbus elongatus TaxID=53332 RepID=UPI0012FA8056|nr:hypothetical protein [Desulfobulbus elongatus]
MTTTVADFNFEINRKNTFSPCKNSELSRRHCNHWLVGQEKNARATGNVSQKEQRKSDAEKGVQPALPAPSFAITGAGQDELFGRA